MILVLHAGIYTTIQDKGRFGYSKLGVPVAGYIDSFSAELANSLLNNKKETALIEVTFGQAKFEFTKTTFICVTGADFSVKLNGDSINLNCVYKVEKGAVLSFGKRKYGAITYIAVKGGINCPRYFGSKSFSKEITPLRLVKENQLNVEDNNVFNIANSSKVKINRKHFTSSNLDCFEGPEFYQLTKKQKENLFKKFTISSDINRVGYRLNELLENNLKPILTSSVLPGTVQLTPSGKVIVLMKDCQVTGGYPRVLQLSEYAISVLSQKITGEKVSFSMKES
ncbi:biotin-dependent carboxylase-like uncharacterized protein [Lutibacter sp. Hel_I_33_5]|uniref:5-oxoprolinase subunit C family protein n=1 Tax=Lutibacter sp. Hel_I_33_5 TaxID=1566289 RepID=UPI00119CF354|nr:biotin-dependent carboxyltransferase family protein [Lutibacter sp. Hel_I_33_5]TVZ55903.1 biotin-dependent carboxylase-like uncharacterized protein [Lutibacter sp. Hel_I_33_5]